MSARLLGVWRPVTRWVAVFGVVTGVGGMVKFGRVDVGLSVFDNSIAAVSLVSTTVALAVLTSRFGWKGTSAFFMAAGFYDAGFDSLMGGVHTFGDTFMLDPFGLAFSTALVVVGWWFAGRPQMRLDLSLAPLFLAYFLLYPPPLFHEQVRFDAGVVPAMFFYVWWQMRRDERGVQG